MFPFMTINWIHACGLLPDPFHQKVSDLTEIFSLFHIVTFLLQLQLSGKCKEQKKCYDSDGNSLTTIGVKFNTNNSPDRMQDKWSRNLSPMLARARLKFVRIWCQHWIWKWRASWPPRCSKRKLSKEPVLMIYSMHHGFLVIRSIQAQVF